MYYRCTAYTHLIASYDPIYLITGQKKKGINIIKIIVQSYVEETKIKYLPIDTCKQRVFKIHIKPQPFIMIF